ncbi:MAG: tetratricopeptide repeat protein, partial [Leptospiraceae bacterium]|nr:tetratricopeptide repeat protein [Leptospiraceae bacterium]
MSRKIIRVFLSFLLLIYVSSLSSETVIEYISNGERLYKEKKYREALNHFKEALEENPSSVKANLGLAKTSLALGSLGDAFNSYKVVLETDPSHKEAITGFSEVLSLQGKNKEALNIIEKALKDEPYNKMLLLQKPKILLRMGRSKSALKFLKEIKTLIDVGYDYNVLLAKSYIANSNFSKASEIVGKLNNKYPEEPEIFYEKARIDLELASRESDPEKIEEYMIEARDLLVTSISLDPEYLDSKRLLVKNYLWLGEYEDAKRVCEEILEAIPSDTEMIYYSAYLNSRLNKNQPAAINFGKLLNLNEIDSFARVSAESFSIAKIKKKHPLRTNLGRYRLDQFEKDSHEFYYRNAEFHINRALDLFPENSHLKKKLADFYYRRGDK